jgi:hypothetical protein
MVSLLIGLTRFWTAMRMAMRDPSFRSLGALTASLLLVGTWVFHQGPAVWRSGRSLNG